LFICNNKSLHSCFPACSSGTMRHARSHSVLVYSIMQRRIEPESCSLFGNLENQKHRVQKHNGRAPLTEWAAGVVLDEDVSTIVITAENSILN